MDYSKNSWKFLFVVPILFQARIADQLYRSEAFQMALAQPVGSISLIHFPQLILSNEGHAT